MNFDWTISISNIITAVVFLLSAFVTAERIYGTINRRAAVFETLLEQHAKTLMYHADRMEKQDELLIRILGDVQRIMGQIEANRSMEPYTRTRT